MVGIACTLSRLPSIQTYNLWSKCKGVAYILNNEDFDPGKRLGSDIDLKNMVHLFKELGYIIMQHSNLTGEVSGLKPSMHSQSTWYCQTSKLLGTNIIEKV